MALAEQPPSPELEPPQGLQRDAGLELEVPSLLRDTDSRAPTLSEEDRQRLREVLREGRAYRARVQAAILLGHRGSPAEDLPELRRALKLDPHYTVRGSAAMAIGNLGCPTGIEPLLGAAAEGHVFVRRAARQAIDALATGEDAIPYLVLARERESAHARMAAVEALRRLETPASRLAMTEFIGDRADVVRDAVVRHMSEWDRAEVVEGLVTGLAHPSFHVRRNAARLSSRYPDPRVIDALVDRLVAPLEEPSVQVTARQTLEEARAHLDLEELVKRVQGIPDREQRIRAIILLGFRGGPRAVEVLSRSAKDPDIRVRAYSVMALGQAGDPKAGPLLVRMHEDPANSRIRGVIRASLQDLAGAATAE